MIHDKGIKQERKQSYLLITCMNILMTKYPWQLQLSFCITVAWLWLVLTSTFFYYPLYIPSAFSKHLSLLCSFTRHGDPNFISDRSGPLAVLPVLGCYSFLLTLIRVQSNILRHTKGSFVFQTYSSLLMLCSSSPISPW